MSASLQRVLDRAILRTVLITCGAVVAIGLLVSFFAATKQDDDEALAIAQRRRVVVRAGSSCRSG